MWFLNIFSERSKKAEIDSFKPIFAMDPGISLNPISKLDHHKRRHSLWLPSPSNCWTAEEPELVSYDPSRDKVSFNKSWSICNISLNLLSHHNYLFCDQSSVTFIGKLYQIGRWAAYNGATESGISKDRQNEDRAFAYRVEKEDKSGVWRSCNTQVDNQEYCLSC